MTHFTHTFEHSEIRPFIHSFIFRASKQCQCEWQWRRRQRRWRRQVVVAWWCVETRLRRHCCSSYAVSECMYVYCLVACCRAHASWCVQRNKIAKWFTICTRSRVRFISVCAQGSRRRTTYDRACSCVFSWFLQRVNQQRQQQPLVAHTHSHKRTHQLLAYSRASRRTHQTKQSVYSRAAAASVSVQ